MRILQATALLLILASFSLASGSGYRQHVHSSRSTENGTLVLVQVLFRHGSRTPLSTLYWPETQYTGCEPEYLGAHVVLHDENGASEPPPILDLNTSSLPGGRCRVGQLTTRGYQQSVKLGQWLRTRYVDKLGLVPPEFDPSAVAGRTTCVQRAIQTLQGVLNGMYPGTASFPAAASREAREIEYGKSTTCAVIARILALLNSKLADIESRPELQAAAAAVRGALGLPDNTTINWIRLHDTLQAMQEEGLPLPAGASPDVMQTISDRALYGEILLTSPIPEQGVLDHAGCDRLARLSLGQLAQRLVQQQCRHAPGACVSPTMHTSHISHTQHANQTSDTSGSTSAVDSAADTTKSSDSSSSTTTTATTDATEETSSSSSSSHTPSSTTPHALALYQGLRARVEAAWSSLPRNMMRGWSAQLHAHTGHGQRSGTSPAAPRLQLFSGHDSTLMPLLYMLDVPISEWPTFTTSLVLELWQGHDQQYNVRVLYKRKPLELPNGQPGGWIPLQALHQDVLAPFIMSPEQHDEECVLDAL